MSAIGSKGRKHAGYFDANGVAHNSAWFAKDLRRRRKAAKSARRARKANR